MKKTDNESQEILTIIEDEINKREIINSAATTVNQFASKLQEGLKKLAKPPILTVKTNKVNSHEEVNANYRNIIILLTKECPHCKQRKKASFGWFESNPEFVCDCGMSKFIITITE